MSSSYETIGELGEGACGKVYLCRQRDTNQMLAQKEIKLAALKTNEISKLLEEVRVLEKFREFPHRNLVEGKGYLQTTNTLYIYMEYCERGSLAADIKSRQEIRFYDEKTILDYTHQIASGLNHMHQLLVLHRDLKPANILITFDGVFKLADFGLGALLSSESSMRASVVGTPLYVAPEIIKEENYNLSCDIWAFGTILYELMALKPAFMACHPAAVINKILNVKLNPLEGSYSEPLKRLVTLMLVLDPSMRPDSSSIVALQFLSNRKIDPSSMRELETLISKKAKGKERKEVKDKQREAEEKQRLEEKEDLARLRIKEEEWRRRKEEYDEMDEKLKQINKLTESELVEHVRGLDEERKRRDVVERQRKEEEQKRPDSAATNLDAMIRAFDKKKLERYEKNLPSGWTDGDRLMKASQEGRIDIITLLIQKGTDVNYSRNNDGFTPLHSASAIGDTSVVKVLVLYGADVNYKTKDGKTPLHVASSNAFLYPTCRDVIRVLLSHNADKNIKNHEGKTPRDIARSDEIRRLLDK